MNRTLLRLISVSLIVLQMSCTYVEQEIESPDFRVEVRYTPMADNHTDVFAIRKVASTHEHRIISVDRDKSVGARLLNDSILVVTDIRSDGYPSLLVNLQDEETPTLFFSGGVPMVHRDTTRLSTMEIGPSQAATFRKNSRSNVYFITMYCPASPYPYAIQIILLGSQGVELISLSECELVFDCIWVRQPSRQRFVADVSDGGLGLKALTITELESSP